MDVDATKQIARQRALPKGDGLPPAHRRLEQVGAPGYAGRTRGEVIRTRPTIVQPSTHQWIGTDGGKDNGQDRKERTRALEALLWSALCHGLDPAQVLVRLDGLYGQTAVFLDALHLGLGLLGRSKE
jgi:hypothetical protein